MINEDTGEFFALGDDCIEAPSPTHELNVSYGAFEGLPTVWALENGLSEKYYLNAVRLSKFLYNARSCNLCLLNGYEFFELLAIAAKKIDPEFDPEKRLISFGALDIPVTPDYKLVDEQLAESKKRMKIYLEKTSLVELFTRNLTIHENEIVYNIIENSI